MNPLFQKIGLAIAFSPTAPAILAEAWRLTQLFKASMILIHVGVHGVEEDEKIKLLIHSIGLDETQVKICWKSGDPVKEILSTCKEEHIDLLIAGALKKENLVQQYIGSIGRKILRKANCSIFIVSNPSLHPKPNKNIVVNAEDSPFVDQAIYASCEIGRREQASWIHIVRELKLLGLTLSANEQRTEREYQLSVQNMVRDEINEVEKILSLIPHDDLKINIKTLSGKSGFELSRFAIRKNADLLIVGIPPRRFSLFDRIFQHDLEYIFANMPCNILMIQPSYTQHLSSPKSENHG